MFQSIGIRKPKKNKFNLSHDVKLSFNMGQLVPVLTEEIVPGDSFKVTSEVMLRLAPMVAPIMHKVDVYMHYFFVPNRLIWDDWEDFITGGEDGTAAPVWPHYSMDYLYNAGFISKGHLSDYLGLPPQTSNPTNDQNVSALPFRAYTTIWNEYYRDQNIVGPATVDKTSGSQVGSAVLVNRVRAWEKDYFTSALPWAQRGDSVTIPGVIDYSTHSDVVMGTGASAGVLDVRANGELNASAPPAQTNFGRIENLDDIGIDINDLRRSSALQRWLELAARGGSRYIEQMLSFFGVASSDARLQRPEYLGGGKQHVMISEVLQTAETATTPQGNMAGHGISVGATNEFTKTFEEHGFVMGIMSVLPRTAYQEGIHRKWTRSDKFDYYFPQFAHLGEQEIKNREIYYDGDDDPDDTWGYQSRYAEYKHTQSRVHGDFRDDLNFYHMGRIFGELPGLDINFIQAAPTHRIFANTSVLDDKLWCQVHHNISALRPMPYFGDPRIIG